MADGQSEDIVENLVQLSPFLKEVVPLIQTTFWALLILASILVFRKPLVAILNVVKERVEGGSGIKAGGFELSELHPQSVQAQSEKLQREVEQSVAGSTDGTEEHNTKHEPTADVREVFLQAEDLALRALQEEFQAAISRQLSVGSGIQVDGSFVVDGQMHIAEVRVVRGRRDIFNIRKSFDQLVGYINRLHWRNVRLILVIVFWGEQDEEDFRSTLSELLETAPCEAEARYYRLNDLRAKFGL